MDLLSILILAFVATALVEDFKKDKGKHRKAKIFHAVILALICFAFAPSIRYLVLLIGNLMATASRDKHIKIWEDDLTLLKVIDFEKFAGHKNSVNKLCWLAEEKILLSVSDDRSMIAWKINL